jgi:predicted GIY-YIG superfamily endonuclease
MDESWKFYIIKNKNYSYAGATPDTERRIRKHNQELSGGAKYTKMVGKGWEYVCVIEGFKNKIDCLRFEWAVKHVAPKKATGIYNRIKKLVKTLNKENWTQSSPDSFGYCLNIIWYKPEYRPKDIEIPFWIWEENLSN